HTKHAGNAGRRADVDPPYTAVRDGAAENLAVDHARYLHGVGVFGTARDLGPCLKPRQRNADLAAGCTVRGHCVDRPLAGPRGATIRDDSVTLDEALSSHCGMCSEEGRMHNRTHQSALIPASLMTFDHFADSALKNSLHSSGVLPI